MTENADSRITRLYLKKELMRWRVLAILALIGAGMLIGETKFGGAKGTPLESDFIGRITIEDFIYDDRDLLDALDDFAYNKRGKALIVWIDTPGGSAVGGEEIYYKLREIAKRKPVVAVMRSMATSAGYLIALGADYIVAREGTITGSIGVLIETAEVTDLVKKIGVNPITVKSTPLKGSPGLFEKPTPEAIASLQALIDDFYHTFVRIVAERRKMNPEEAYQLADGRVYSGNQAVESNLVDAIGGEEDVLTWLQLRRNIDIDLNVRDIEPKMKDLSFLQEFSESISRKFFGKTTSSLDGLISVWHPTH